MKSAPLFSTGLTLGLILFAAEAGLLADAKPKPAAKSTNVVAIAADAPIPQSVFNIPATPKQGRNPFFPQSSATLPVQKPKENIFDLGALVLNGITSPPKRMAMINGRSFEVGESGDVKLPNGGRIAIQCVEIQDESAVIMVGGQRRELRLRSRI